MKVQTRLRSSRSACQRLRLESAMDVSPCQALMRDQAQCRAVAQALAAYVSAAVRTLQDAKSVQEVGLAAQPLPSSPRESFQKLNYQLWAIVQAHKRSPWLPVLYSIPLRLCVCRLLLPFSTVGKFCSAAGSPIKPASFPTASCLRTRGWTGPPAA